jgi:hypothetical protein
MFPMMTRFDHAVIGVRNLDEACAGYIGYPFQIEGKKAVRSIYLPPCWERATEERHWESQQRRSFLKRICPVASTREGERRDECPLG